MTDTPATSAPPPERDLGHEVRLCHVLYALHLLAPFTAWTLAAVAMVIGLFKRDDVRATWVETHYAWLVRTFWWGLLWAILAWGTFWLIGILTLGFGMFVLWILPLTVVVWYLYRVIKGWLRLNDGKPT